MPQPLEGISVLDFSHGMAGSIATMVMADFGAEVIKVEPPGGHRFHAGPPSRQWDRGKKSVTLDLKTGEGRRDALALSRRSHVVIESYRPGVATRLGVGYKELGGQRPDLVYCSISAWGPTGPYARYKGYEGLVEAKTGRMMWYAGQTQREGPHYATVSLASYAAGMAAVGGGVIVNMASESGLEGSAGQSVYAASKAAVYSLTRSWAKELGPRGVRVVGVAPGPLEPTGMTGSDYMAALAKARETTPEAIDRGYASAIPLGRAGTLTEVADVVLFLASPRASYVTGTVINVSGGKSRA